MKENLIKINKLHTRWKWDVHGVILHEVPNFCNCKCKIRRFGDEIRLKWRLSVVSEYDVQIREDMWQNRVTEWSDRSVKELVYASFSFRSKPLRPENYV